MASTRTLQTFVCCFAWTSAATGCSEEAIRSISIRWETKSSSSSPSPLSLGPGERLLVCEDGKWRSLERNTGETVEGPFATLESKFAPQMVDDRVFLVSTGGSVQVYNLVGELQGEAPGSPLFDTSSPVAVEGGVSVASTVGRVVHVLKDLSVPLDQTLDRNQEGVPSILNVADSERTRATAATETTTYIATDLGNLVALQRDGTRAFRAPVQAPAFAPSARAGKIAVGDLNSVWLFGSDGTKNFQTEVGAQVAGTRILGSGDVIAWTTGPRVVQLGSNGEIKRSYAPNSTPIDVVDADHDRLAVFEEDGTITMLGTNGESEATLKLTGSPAIPVAQDDENPGIVYVSAADTLYAITFVVEN